MECVPFMEVEDEPRIAAIVNGLLLFSICFRIKYIYMILDWIGSGEVPEYKAFTEERASKRNRRHKKYALEAREARHEKTKASNEASLEQQIMKRQTDRGNSMASFFDKLMDKYAHVDDDDEFQLDDPKTRKSYKKAVGKTGKKPLTQKTKGGRVEKAKK